MKVCFLLERGAPPRLNPILARTFEILEGRGIGVVVRYPEEELVRLDTLAVEADLYLLKSDTELSLSLASALEAVGARVINRIDACMLSKDKVLAAATLARAGLPAPRSLVAAVPALLGPEAAKDALIFKPYRGYHGAGVAVAATASDLPAADAYPDFAFAQVYLSRGRKDLKVFGIGDETFGARKAFSADSFLAAGEPIPLPPEVEDTARRCARAFGLELYGIDFAEDEDGLRIIDVNYFPGYRGVPEAPRRLAEFIVARAR